MKNLKTIFLIMMTLSVCAQHQEEIDPPNPKARQRIQAARIGYITEQLALTPEEAEKFWPVYRELSEKRLELLKQYQKAKQNLDPEKSAEQNDKDLIALSLKLKQQELDLEKAYSSRLLNAISAKKLKLLPEAERKFRQMVIDQIRRREMMDRRRENFKDGSLKQRN